MCTSERTIAGTAAAAVPTTRWEKFMQFADNGFHQPGLFRSREYERRLDARADETLHEREAALALPFAAGRVIGNDDDVAA